MHEMPIASAIVEQAVQAAAPYGATHIRRIEVEIGRMRQIVPEALQVAFAVVGEDTIAQGAELVIVEINMLAECQECGRRFVPDISFYVCPACGQANVRMLAGNDMILKSLECETPEEASGS